MDLDDGPRCDVRGCVERGEVLCEDKWHCFAHIEDVLERWQAVEIAPVLREMLEPLAYR